MTVQLLVAQLRSLRRRSDRRRRKRSALWLASIPATSGPERRGLHRIPGNAARGPKAGRAGRKWHEAIGQRPAAVNTTAVPPCPHSWTLTRAFMVCGSLVAGRGQEAMRLSLRRIFGQGFSAVRSSAPFRPRISSAGIALVDGTSTCGLNLFGKPGLGVDRWCPCCRSQTSWLRAARASRIGLPLALPLGARQKANSSPRGTLSAGRGEHSVAGSRREHERRDGMRERVHETATDSGAGEDSSTGDFSSLAATLISEYRARGNG
jgi:hypothetical protein